MAIRRFVIAGLGNFGSGLVETLHAWGHDVIAIDLDEARVDRIRPLATLAVTMDAADSAGLTRVGVARADAAVISLGDDLASSVLAVLALQELGVTEIYAKAISGDHAKILELLGVLEVIRPERETALRLARRLSLSLLNYMPIAPGYSIQELPTPDPFIGHTLLELRLPQRYSVTVVAIHDLLHDEVHVVPPADYLLKDSDTLTLIGSDGALGRIARLL